MSKLKEPLDRKSLDRYSKSGFCPACDEENDLEFTSSDFDGPWVSQDVKCNKCGSTWKDNYKFQGISGLENKQGAPYGDGDYYFPNWEAMMKAIIEHKKMLPTLIGIDNELDALIDEAMKT